MAINKKLNSKPLVTPKGIAHWVKVNSRIDEYKGKKKYRIHLTFDAENEAKMKKMCDDFREQAKKEPEYVGKEWLDDESVGYSKGDNGKLDFSFWTYAFYTDKKTGKEVQKKIPVLNMATRKTMGMTEGIGDGSEVRVSFDAGAYWDTKKSNGVNLYINKIVVDKLVEYGGGNDFGEFGESVASDADEFKDMTGADEEIPI